MKNILLVVFAIIIICNCVIRLYTPFEVDSNIMYSTENDNVILNSYDDILNFLSNDEEHMLVIGRTGCHYCEMFKPILMEAQKEYRFQYRYVDVLGLSAEDRNLLLHSDIVVPGKCRSEEIDGFLYEGIGTPLTLFIKNKTSYDCIRGYVDKNSLVDILKNNSFINI